MERSKRAKQLSHALTLQQIKTGSLGDVFAAHNALHAYSRELVTEAQLDGLVARLLASEESVGGPYQTNGHTDLTANTHIAEFARRVAKPLPKMEAFLAAQPNRALAPPTSHIAQKAAELARLVAAHGQTCAVRQAEVLQTVRAALSERSQEPLLGLLMPFVERVYHANCGQEIALLPYFFVPPGQLQGTPDWRTLGAANLCGWAAYLIYDAIMDDGQLTNLLPAANVAMRTSHELFAAHIPQPGYVANAFTAIDNANAWEIRYCRFAVQKENITVGKLPRYGVGNMLAMRSWGHALGPLGMVLESQRAKTATGLTHFLIARQLQDDLQDWEQDLRHGHISYVVALLLRDMHIPAGNYPLKKLVAKAAAHFGHHAAARIGRLTLAHIRASKRNFAGILQESSGMYDVLFAIELAAKKF